MEQTTGDGEVTACSRCPVGLASGVGERGRCPFVPRKRPAGAVLHVVGDAVERIWFIKAGTVLVTRSMDDEQVEGTPWAIRRAGGFLGLEGLVRPEHHESARALTDVTLCSAPRDTVETWLQRHGTASRVLLDAVLRSGVRERPLRGNADGTAPQRAAAWLLGHAPQVASRQVTRRVLAGLLGMRPETLSRTLRAIEAQGAILQTRGRIEVVDRGRLRAIARRRRGATFRGAD